jgi:hypothetical protein
LRAEQLDDVVPGVLRVDEELDDEGASLGRLDLDGGGWYSG